LVHESQELWDRDVPAAELPVLLTTHDPLIESTMRALSAGLASGLPDLYAQTSAELLSVHLLLRHCELGTVRSPRRDDPSLCGYENPAHFVSAFRRVEGVAPTAYRTPSTIEPDSD
jgi:hypothetical protein